MASEIIANRYQRLFEVRIMHHFWLDEGAALFDAMPEPQKTTRLLTYDVRRVLEITPTASTHRAMAGLRCVFRATALGLVVAAPIGSIIPDTSLFEFVVSVRDAAYSGYTAGTLSPQTLHTLFQKPTQRSVRFKENVAVYSNLTGTTRGAGASRQLFLSKEIPPLRATDRAEALIDVGGALCQLTGDEPGAATQELDPVLAHSPVYANQGDIPPIVPPAGIVGDVPARGIQLEDDTRTDVHALIRIAAVKPGDTEFSCTAGGTAKESVPVFQIRLKNRSTVWRYFSRSSPGPALQEAGPLPLTHFGNAGLKQKPTDGSVKIERAGAGVRGLFSEIYI